ncbi:TetR/AcrR family transcriptional regulator [Kordiimonas sp. SCSIO 12603]|uniref:TetR/AcrR family transcriptional regulator n=1 Tax=Kordiimonas sp. SCSIO 12603 TaxID=2829596 RepID=UPI002106247E|nr:TetR/AcrR family transcriptional regulator [Kordiimonas sp. SCSIO 12603]UTW59842.1 TetR/AcrR family transcriptional regulator [Kordiimonas sp. SCSIO 12603]
MGRPAKFNRDDAIAIALDAFWEQGYEPTSVSELSSRMSITRSSFYNSFVSREALFSEVLALYGKQSCDRFMSDLKEGDPILPAFRKVFENLIDARMDDEDAKGCLVTNGMANNENSCEVAHVFRDIMGTRVDRYTELLEHAIDSGELTGVDNPRTTAATFVSQMVGINMMSKVIRDRQQLYAMAETILKGLGLAETPASIDAQNVA